MAKIPDFEPTLSEALRTGRLEEFIEEAERKGVGPVDRSAFEGAVKKAAVTER